MHSLVKFVLFSSALIISLVSFQHFEAAQISGQTVNSKIDAATVYTQGATINRSATVSLPRGNSKVYFENLPRNIDLNSIRVIIADKSIQLGQVSMQAANTARAVDAQVVKLEDAINEVDRQITALDDSNKTANLQLSFLQSVAQGYAKESWMKSAQGAADVSSWRTALDVLGNGANSAHGVIRENQQKRKTAEQTRSKLRRDLQDLRGGQLSSSTLAVSLSANKAANTRIALEYFQHNASWVPTYEIRLDSNTRAISIVQQAVVRQGGSEDWQNIDLTLSTNKPSGALQAPSVESQFLNIGPPRPRFNSRKQAGQNEAQIEEVIVTASRKSKVASSVLSVSDMGIEFDLAEVVPDMTDFTLSYPIPGKTSVLNDADDEQIFKISDLKLDVQLVTQAVPSITTDAFLAARTKYNSQLPLLGGNMRIYVDGTYMGNTHLKTTLPGEEITLPMGPDQRVDVKIADQGGQGGKRGITGKRRTEISDHIYTLTNRHSRAIELEVLDVLPISRNKQLVVGELKQATPPTEEDTDGKRGVILWKQSLPPGDAWQIRHGYSLTYPLGMEVQGRRN